MLAPKTSSPHLEPGSASHSRRSSTNIYSPDTSYLDSFNLKSVSNTINLDKPGPGERRASSSSKRRTSTAVDDYAQLYKGMDSSSRRMVDEEEEYSEDEETGTSSEDDSDSDDSKDSDSEIDSDLSTLSSKLVPTNSSGNMLTAVEEERRYLANSQFRVKSLIDDALPLAQFLRLPWLSMLHTNEELFILPPLLTKTHLKIPHTLLIQKSYWMPDVLLNSHLKSARYILVCLPNE